MNLNAATLADDEDDKEDAEMENDDEGDRESQPKPQKKKTEKKEELVEKKPENIDELRSYKNNTYIIFHIIMFLVAVYGTMLLTNWGATYYSGKQFWKSFTACQASYYIKATTTWLGGLLYIWTLIAPRIF